MIPTNFRIAMNNRLRRGPYHFPATIVGDSIPERLIVERRDDTLLISDTTPNITTHADPPDPNIAERHTLFGILINPDTTVSKPEFLLVRQLGADTAGMSYSTPGMFFPADGIARLSNLNGVISLEAHGRHMHNVEMRGNTPTIIDVAVPPSIEIPGGLNWHFEATQLPWKDEVLA